jgi:hypothetical protein
MLYICSYKFTDKLYHIMLYRLHVAWAGFELTTLVVIGSDYIGSCKFKYHTIETTTAPIRKSLIRTALKSNRNTHRNGSKNQTPTTHIHDHPISWLDTNVSMAIQSSEDELVLSTWTLSLIFVNIVRKVIQNKIWASENICTVNNKG